MEMIRVKTVIPGFVILYMILLQTMAFGEMLSGELVGLLQHGDEVFHNLSIAFSSDGRTLASGGKDRAIRLWDLRTQKEIGVLKGHTDGLYSIAFNPDGSVLASSAADKTVRLWDVRTQEQIGLAHPGPRTWFIESVAFSPEGKILAYGGAFADRLVRLWDVEEQKHAGLLELDVSPFGHRDTPFSIAFSPNGKLLAFGGVEDKAIHFMDVETQEQVGLLEGHDGDVSSVAFSPDGKWLTSADNSGIILLWQINATGVKPLGKQLITWGAAKIY